MLPPHYPPSGLAGWCFQIIVRPARIFDADQQQVFPSVDDVAHEFHDEEADENRQCPFEPLGQNVHNNAVSWQYAKQVLERPALDGVISRHARHERAGHIACKVTERSVDEKLPELLAAQRIAYELAHQLSLHS